MASLLRGRRYVHEELAPAADAREEQDRTVSATTGDDSTRDDSAEPAVVVASERDDLEGGQGGIGRVGDPAPVGGDLAQRR